jgi:hypothetical protein
MTSMPTIDDRLVYQLRRSSKQRASYSMGRAGHAVGRSSRVVPQITGLQCGLPGVQECDPCDDGVCVGGHCVSIYAPEAAGCRSRR